MTEYISPDNLQRALLRVKDKIETADADEVTARNAAIVAAVQAESEARTAEIASAVATEAKAREDAVATRYQLPAGGVPKSDLAGTVQTSLGKADSAYQKPAAGIPKTDLVTGVQTSLGKADTAYQKASTGIPKSDLASDVQTSLGKADSALQSHQSLAAYATTASVDEKVSAERTFANTLSNRISEIEKVIPNTAAAHNAFWGGRDLTNVYTVDQISAKLANGDFSNLFVGDYIRKSVTINGVTTDNVAFRFMDFDYHMNMGDSQTTRHHILVMPDSCLKGGESSNGNLYWLMNNSNTTAGGYIGSKMWGTHIPAITTGIKNAFGSSHILKHRELLTKGVSTSAPSAAGAGYTGSANDWAWYDVEVNLPNENMVYGGQVFSSSAFDTGERKQQLAAFRLSHALTCNRVGWWLSSVVSSTDFARVGSYGNATSNVASNTWIGVRPCFLLA